MPPRRNKAEAFTPAGLSDDRDSRRSSNTDSHAAMLTRETDYRHGRYFGILIFTPIEMHMPVYACRAGTAWPAMPMQKELR